MNQTQLTQVALRIVGILTVIQSIPLLGAILQTSSIIDNELASKPLLIMGTVVPFVLMAASGFCLIVFGSKLAAIMFPQIGHNSEMGGISSRNLQAIAFSIVGILLMAFAIPHMADLIWNYHAIRAAGDETPMRSILDNDCSYALRTGVQFLIGLFLFIGSTTVAAFWHTVAKRIRSEHRM